MPKIYVIGTRGFPNVQGGVETHCKELYTRLSGKPGMNIVVCGRSPYIGETSFVYKGVNIISIYAPRLQGWEALVHTALSSVSAIIAGADIVHFHNIGPGLFIPLVKLFGCKTVLTYHSKNYLHKKWGFLSSSFLRLCERVSLYFADSIIFVAQHLEDDLASKKKVDASWQVIANGVAKCFYEGKSNSDIFDRHKIEVGKYIFLATRISVEKGVIDLCEAFFRSHLASTHKLVIAGDADHKSAYSEAVFHYAEKMEQIVFIGVVTGNDLALLYRNCALFVLPSHFEGHPISLLEAMSFDCKVLVSDIRPNKEIGLPPECYFPEGNVEELAKMMKDRLVDGMYCDYSTLLKKYNWDVIADKVSTLYQDLLI